MGGILNILKYLLMFFNFVIFVSIETKAKMLKHELFLSCKSKVVGVIVFGIAVWVLVDAPKFTELFAKVCPSNSWLSSRSFIKV